MLPAVWPLPRSLAATSGITCLFSFPRGTKMFQFPPFAPTKLFIHFVVTLAGWVPPFGHYRVKAFLAARRYFSQPDTSFIASRYLGILRTPLIASTKASLPLLSRIKTLTRLILHQPVSFLLLFLLLTSYSLVKLLNIFRLKRYLFCLHSWWTLGGSNS